MVQYFTAEGIKKLRDELDRLKTVETREIAALLKYAASFGDLKENAGYDDAKERQADLVKKIKDLEAVVNDAIVCKTDKTDKVQVCSGVLISMDGENQEFQIVAPAESDILKNKLSYSSPLGAKLVGKKVGDEFNFCHADKTIKIKILEIK